MINSLADSVDAARVGARVATLLVEAGLVTRTVLVDNTLGVDTGGDTVLDAALAIHSTW